MKTLQELKDKLEQERLKIMQKAQPFFLKSTKAIFKKYPECQSFEWTQYTPYFNDGDDCEFTVHPCYEINGAETYGKIPDWVEPCNKEIDKLIFSFSEEDMEFMFGEGKITCTREGLVVEDCEHE